MARRDPLRRSSPMPGHCSQIGSPWLPDPTGLLDGTDSPTQGYRLAVDFCAHDDARCGTDLNGPSRDRLEEIIDFIGIVEAREYG
jgi:hypothetical protein